MAIVVVTSTETSRLEGSAPRADEIAAAMERARLAGAEDVRGTWVGPGPRVTRVAEIPAFRTTATWVYAWPTRGPWTAGAPLRALSVELRDAVARELATTGSWGPVRVVPWSAEVHGELAQWENGELSRTRTRNSFPTGAGRLDPAENPTGPTTRETRPGTLRDLGGDALSSLAPWALAGLALWAWSSRSRSR